MSKRLVESTIDQGMHRFLADGGFDLILTQIQIPIPKKNTKSYFIKFAFRKTIDFPIVNCTAVISGKNGNIASCRICLNGVYNVPYRATDAEKFLIGKSIDERISEETGKLAVSEARPLRDNQYIVICQVYFHLRSFLFFQCSQGKIA